MDKIKLIIVGIFILMVNNVSGYSLSHYTRNAYNFEPIQYAHVFLLNNDTNNTLDGFSDSEGKTTFTLFDEGNFTITVIKVLYSNDTVSFFMNDSKIRISYLTYKTDSQVKFILSEKTLYSHTYCFYDDNTQRIYLCDSINNTPIYLDMNKNYTIDTDINLIEQLTTLNTAKQFFIQISIFILGIVITGMIIVICSLSIIILIRSYLKR